MKKMTKMKWLDFMKNNNMKFNIIFTMGGEQEDEFCDHDMSDKDEDDDGEKKPSNKKYKRGEIVEVKFPDWDEWYEGTVVKVNDNDTFKIKFDDAEVRRYGTAYDKVKRKYIRPRNDDADTLYELEKLTNVRKKKGKKGNGK